MNKTKRPAGLSDKEYIKELEYKLERLEKLYWNMADMFDKVNADNLQYQALSQVKRLDNDGR
jgi:hypothetical protein